MLLRITVVDINVVVSHVLFTSCSSVPYEIEIRIVTDRKSVRLEELGSLDDDVFIDVTLKKGFSSTKKDTRLALKHTWYAFQAIRLMNDSVNAELEIRPLNVLLNPIASM